jgi:FAD/FMN-containing dehydrogenase
MSLTRRQFIRRSRDAALAAGFASQLEWLAACGEETRSADWDELARRLDGAVVRPGQDNYPKLSLPYNHRYADVHPAGIALCEGEDDVRESVLWAREQEQPVAIRSGGHNYAGYSTGPGLVIDLAKLDRVDVNDRAESVSIEPGATNVQVYAGLTPHGVAISAGRCPTVALGGLVLGGGFGFSSRKLGLTSDSLLESRMVDASGELLTLSEDENPDLFWAIRGAGSGNFGVCTHHRFRTQPVGDVTIYDISWPWRTAPDALGALQEAIASAPDEFSCRMGGGATGDPGTKPVISFSALGQYFGPKRELMEILDPVLSAARPSKRLIERRTFRQAKDYFFDNVPAGSFSVKSSYADEPLSHEAAAILFDGVERWPGSSNDDGAGFAIFAWGGEMGRPAPDATAFVHRDALLLLALDTAWGEEDDQSTVDANVDWLDQLYADVRPHLSPAAYQNFIDPDLEDWESAYYGANFERLTEVKAKRDPDDFFSFAQSIPVA